MKLLDRFYGSVMFDVFVVLYIYICRHRFVSRCFL